MDTAKVRFHGGGIVAGQAGDGKAHHAALLHPVGRECDVGAGLQREPERKAVPAGGPGRVLHARVLPDGSGGAALKLGGKVVLRQPPDRQPGLVIAVCGEQELRILVSRPRKHDAAAVGLDGQGGVAGPIGQGEGGVCVVQHAQLLHGERFRAGEHLVQHAAQQRHLPAGTVHFQRLPAKLRFGCRAGALGGKGIAYGHHGPQQHCHAQQHADDPE